MRPFALLLIASALARAGDGVEMKVEDKAGDTLVVTEEERTEGKIRYEAVKGKSKADFGKRKQDFLSLKKWQFDQDCEKSEGEMSTRKRDFAIATKEELEEDGKGKKKTQFPHHQRKVTVAKTKEGQAVYIDGEQPEEGIGEQGWMDVLPLLLPKDALAQGKEYEIDAAKVMTAWSHGAFDAKKASGSGKGKWADTEKVGKLKCAKLWVNFTMRGEGKDLPTVETNQQGYVWFALDEKKIVKADFGGAFMMKIRLKDTPDVGDVDLTVTGTMRENFVAEVFGK
ncbi:MAG: hypothetical protein FD180_5041 [Planctomycetota bacterium]|nr:MAG: hypothetical protein FD180_5041 [Planctomycetota bacterium]